MVLRSVCMRYVLCLLSSGFVLIFFSVLRRLNITHLFACTLYGFGFYTSIFLLKDRKPRQLWYNNFAFSPVDNIKCECEKERVLGETDNETEMERECVGVCKLCLLYTSRCV